VINRANWKRVNQFIQYRIDYEQLSGQSARNEETLLRHVLEWADEKSFKSADKIHPTFPQYLLTITTGKIRDHLTNNYMEKIIKAAYRLFNWLSTRHKGYRHLKTHYLDTLKAPKIPEQPREPENVSYEEILDISKAPAQTLKERRIRAAAVFLWLSGMRVGAFASLPLCAFDLNLLEVKQWPSLGVRTKNRKFGTTYLWDIPELIEVIRAWDYEVRELYSPQGVWFAPLSPVTGEFDLSINVDNVGENRGRIVTRNLEAWLSQVDLPYHSPHKFRHGHAIYGKKNARTIGDFKAISRNLMHSSLQTTDRIYGLFSKDDIKERIHGLSKTKEIDLLEEIPPQDRPMVLEIYKAVKAKRSD